MKKSLFIQFPSIHTCIHVLKFCIKFMLILIKIGFPLFLITLLLLCLLSYISPFEWCHSIVPTVPDNFIDILRAPSINILGCHSNWHESPEFNNIDDAVIVKLDEDVVESKLSSVPLFPELPEADRIRFKTHLVYMMSSLLLLEGLVPEDLRLLLCGCQQVELDILKKITTFTDRNRRGIQKILKVWPQTSVLPPQIHYLMLSPIPVQIGLNRSMEMKERDRLGTSNSFYQRMWYLVRPVIPWQCVLLGVWSMTIELLGRVCPESVGKLKHSIFNQLQ
uniref:cDENN domain-containing protein n=1 Tax=Amphimedon queenslandica TaxID=400682 RepID=A0A1X7TJF7_AMPQE